MLYNVTQKKKIIGKTKIAETLFSKALGLMFYPKRHDFALIFTFFTESRILTTVHMLFVFFPLDVLFLNSEKKVVDKKTLKPFTLSYSPKKAAKYFIELPEKKASGVKIGDKLKW